MSVADQAERAAIALLQALALADADEAHQAFVELLRDELAAAKQCGCGNRRTWTARKRPAEARLAKRTHRTARRKPVQRRLA